MCDGPKRCSSRLQKKRRRGMTGSFREAARRCACCGVSESSGRETRGSDGDGPPLAGDGFSSAVFLQHADLPNGRCIGIRWEVGLTARAPRLGRPADADQGRSGQNEPSGGAPPGQTT